MRIRKRSGALITSSSSGERAKSSTSSIAISTDNGNGEEAEFLLPLVAAVMDVQRSEEEDGVEGEGDHGTRAIALGTHTRPANSWRKALQLQRSSDGNSENQVLEDGGEGKKEEFRWNGNGNGNGSMRNQWDNIRLFTKEGSQKTLLRKEDSSSSAEKEINGGRDEEWKLPKSGLLEMGTLRSQQKKSNVHGVKRKRSKDEIGYIKGWKDDATKIPKKLRHNTYFEQGDGRNVNEKAMPKKRCSNNNNEAEGSQCRRRNGRGWRCSQRTLVGYSLCEHHLGKGRLRSINSNNNNTGISTGIVNNKAGTCKLKELRLIDAS